MIYDSPEHRLVIDTEAEVVQYDSTSLPILDYFISKGGKGAITTADYTIKLSKDQAVIFETSTNVLIATLYLAPQDSNIFKATSVLSTGESPTKTDALLVGSYELKQGTTVNLYSNKINNYTTFGIDINTDGIVVLTEIVVDTVRVGTSTNYITSTGNKLFISTTFNCKWNGIPIGKLQDI
jgi:hypothetical protein